jgi:MYXO-CTERM domain-containing protein
MAHPATRMPQYGWRRSDGVNIGQQPYYAYNDDCTGCSVTYANARYARTFTEVGGFIASPGANVGTLTFTNTSTGMTSSCAAPQGYGFRKCTLASPISVAVGQDYRVSATGAVEIMRMDNPQRVMFPGVGTRTGELRWFQTTPAPGTNAKDVPNLWAGPVSAQFPSAGDGGGTGAAGTGGSAGAGGAGTGGSADAGGATGGGGKGGAGTGGAGTGGAGAAGAAGTGGTGTAGVGGAGTGGTGMAGASGAGGAGGVGTGGAGMSGAGTAGSLGAGGGASAAGGGPGAGSAGTTEGQSASSSGCSCGVANGHRAGAGSWLVLLALSLARARRRRSRGGTT